MAKLLQLYQQDAKSGELKLDRAFLSAAARIDATKEYLDTLRARHDHMDDVPIKQRRLVASGLNLAAQSFQTGAINRDEMPMPAVETLVQSPKVGRFTWLLIIMMALLVVNLWIMSIAGVFSIFILLVATVMLNWSDIGVIERRLRRSAGGARSSATRKPAGAASRPRQLDRFVEDVVRRIDEMAEIDPPDAPAIPPPVFNTETLTFFQDILEAKLADDKEFAFKKISRTVTQVLWSEGLEVVTDAANQAALFRIDTVADAIRAGQVEAIRPALVRNDECALAGYAQRFVAGP